MGELGRLIEAHRDEQQYPPSNAAIGRAVGVTRTTIANWLNGDGLPSPENLRRLATLLGVPYWRVLEAALVDSGYMPRESESRGNTPAIELEEVTSSGDPLPEPGRREQPVAGLPRPRGRRRSDRDG